MTNERTDQELIAALQRQEVQALEELYDRFGGLAYSLAFKVLGDGSLAEDVVQEVFFNLWRQAQSFDGSRGSVRAWLLASSRHRSIDFLRRRQAKAERDVELSASEFRLNTDDLWSQVANHLDHGLLRQALAQLPESQRQALELAYFGGLTQAEIADATDVPLGTVKGRLRLALEKMKDLLESQGIRTAG
ncbi:MAG: sigma-70 family RNA polymerase sigma factor [Chloroflexi bacterium]|nr:sigma-70 family RNA polymerase sigma factor [Chloroflexota bacterium]